jgi:hypothetical protein
MNRTFQKHAAVAVIALGSLVYSATARGTTIAEWDFRVDEDLTIAANGASTNATLQNGASVSTGAALPGSLTTNPKLLNGLLNTAGEDANRGDISQDTWDDFYGTNDLGSGSVIMVFKPTIAGGRYTFFGHKVSGGSGSANGNVWAFMESNGGNYDVDIRVGQDAALAHMVLPIATTDWYFWAGSWTQGGLTFSYLRNITTGAAANTVSGTVNVAMNADTMNGQLYVGLRTNGLESARSPMAFVQLTDQYINTTAAWDAIYSDFINPVPEPTSVGLLITGTAMLLIRRRQRR